MSPPACNQSIAEAQTLLTLQEAFVTCGCTNVTTDPCAIDIAIDYSQGLHIGAVFIILFCSTLGAAVPLFSKASERYGASKYVITVGKHVGTGIVLACALIHMLQPASQSLTSICVPWEFNTDYNAYAFLFSMLSIIVLHCFETVLRFHLQRPRPVGEVTDLKGAENDNASTSSTVFEALEGPLQAGMIEFGLTVHSIFIGFTVGVVDDDGLHSLLVALCFHQFFEGIALGARLADAEFSACTSAVLLIIFACSAPLGIAVGIGATTSLNTNGVTFLLVQGTFDGVCSGILLYVGMQLLLIDFPRDIKTFCSGVDPRKHLFGLFVGLWIGAGFMAYIGKYL